MPKGNKKLSEKKQEQIKEMINEGSFISEIARKLNIHRNTVRKYADGE